MTITVYTKPACVQCNATYKALDKQGIAYDKVDISLEVRGARLRDGAGLSAGARRSGRKRPLVGLPARPASRPSPAPLVSAWTRQ